MTTLMNGLHLGTTLRVLKGVVPSGDGYAARCPICRADECTLAVLGGPSGRHTLRCDNGCLPPRIEGELLRLSLDVIDREPEPGPIDHESNGAFTSAVEEGNSEAPDPPGILLSDVEPEQLEWLWWKRLPLGKLAVLDGDPGLGKSALTTDAAARVSVGRDWPDGTPCEAGGVVILSAEDGLADTIRPRLDAAGGDPSRVLALATVADGDAERLISIPKDLDVVQRGIERVSARLVIVDPLMAFFSGDVDAHKDQGVRRALAPLAKLAEKTGAAVVVVRHLNKAAGGNSLYRGGGSIGIVGAARCALLVAKDPQDERRRVLAPLKSNLAAPAPSLAFALATADNGAVRVEYKGETSHTADALLAAPTDPEERSALDEAAEFLRDALKDGPVSAKQVKKEARDADVTEITLKRAKAALGVKSEKEADGSWTWTLRAGRQGDHKERGDPQASNGDPLDPLMVGKPNSAGWGEKQGERGDPLEKPGEFGRDKPNSGLEGGQGDQGDHRAQGKVLAFPPRAVTDDGDEGDKEIRDGGERARCITEGLQRLLKEHPEYRERRPGQIACRLHMGWYTPFVPTEEEVEASVKRAASNPDNHLLDGGCGEYS